MLLYFKRMVSHDKKEIVNINKIGLRSKQGFIIRFTFIL